MKHRICLAWFCDLDAPEQSRSKPRKEQAPSTSPAQSGAQNGRPKVKDVSELRRMFGRR